MALSAAYSIETEGHRNGDELREAIPKKKSALILTLSKGGGGVQPKSKLFKAPFFCFDLDIFQGRGGLTPIQKLLRHFSA